MRNSKLLLSFVSATFIIFFSFFDFRLGLATLLAALLISTLDRNYKPLLIFLLIGLLLFKNILTSSLSYHFDNELTKISLTINQGLDFILCVTALIYLSAARPKLLIPSKRFLLYILSIFFCYATALLKVDISSATISLRMLLYPLALYLTGRITISLGVKKYDIFQTFVSFGVISVIFIAFEVSFPDLVYEITGAHQYISLKLGLPFPLSAEQLVQRNTRYLFNSELLKNISMLRPLGTLLHPISLGYLLSFCSLLLISKGKVITPIVLMLGIAILGTKGPLLTWFICVLLYWIPHKGKHENRIFITSLILLLTTYVATTFSLGLSSGNPHMVKLLWAIGQLPSVLFGRGLGSAGVQSSIASGSDEVGFSDTGLGVLIGQFGIFSILIYLFYLSLATAGITSRDTSERMISLFVICVLANSIFQEEGFSPYSLGIGLFYLGSCSLTKWKHKREEDSFSRQQRWPLDSTVKNNGKS
ncbi:hypothetical protein IB256_22570 [Pseudomonas sp. PDM17]|uniref:hypothetical protein n=1 Tax=Pseudomonas sp. PDM17 TaxID=2769285 RepID=UPI0017810135|nr:hypothetical protein [Pseudomonas sp. PDM17]MBD9503587.1 hypothetical protein [Pseudomonas sp. PDM17]